MKQVVRIDSAGFYVEPVILDDSEEIPSDCVAVIPPSLFKAKFVGGQWVEGATQEEIDGLKNTSQPVSELKQIQKQQELMQKALDDLILGGIL
jgi:hypothetical protein